LQFSATASKNTILNLNPRKHCLSLR